MEEPAAPGATGPAGKPRTLIVGGGIGGLTAAVALARRGVPVEVVEQADSFAAVGAGITIQANAHAVLDALGIPLPASACVPIGRVLLRNARGRILVEADASRVRAEPPSVNIHRADLHQALLDAAQGIPLHAGRRVEGIEAGEEEVEVHFADGSRGSWDLVVGADGVRSAVRRSLLGEAGAATRYSGQTCWRFALEAPDLVPDVTIEQWAPGRRVGVVPLAAGCIYVYLVESAPEGTPGPESGHPRVLREKFAGLHPHLDPVLERLDGVPIHHGDLVEHVRVHFGQGRVVLIGDAAHAMTPNLGQGAGCAIEDAGALALLLERGHEPSALVAALDARQRSRVTAVTRTAWRIGRMAHQQGRFVCWLRDGLLRLLPRWMAERQTASMWQPGLDLAAELSRGAAP